MYLGIINRTTKH